ncbi:hypothetical protein M8C21_017977 [Ambrosia artemisiifolia]|uniref:Uncharacterized protein n=1 Tax=Ambrosia artemisiifolia TaxID=4212 RepID=A0AAD5BUN4_AMBAR|nr:hypothetical protein M8C21_017977 [Ambrosia artemisiifolia]
MLNWSFVGFNTLIRCRQTTKSNPNWITTLVCLIFLVELGSLLRWVARSLSSVMLAHMD